MRLPRESYTIGTINTRGYNTSCENIAMLTNMEKIDVLAITETKLDPLTSFPPGRKFEAFSISRNQGGVALSISPDVKYKFLFADGKKEYQYVAIEVEDITIVGTYIRPGTKKRRMPAIMEAIRKKVKGRVIVIGDLNARHVNWSQGAQNIQGQSLARWASQRNWEIQAPAKPTFLSAITGGYSTLDIAVTRNCPLESIETVEGPWDGSSDHLAVIAKVATQRKNKIKRKIKISRKRREKEELIQRADADYPTSIPPLTAEFDKATSMDELCSTFLRWNAALTAPFMPSGKPPPPFRARHFWTNELERLSKTRSRLYRRQRRTSHPKDIGRFRAINRLIQRKAKKLNDESYNEYRRKFDRATFSTAASKLSNLIRVKNKNALRHGIRLTGDVDQAKFAEFVSKKFPPTPTDTPVMQEKFEVSPHMEELIAVAAKRCTRKATRRCPRITGRWHCSLTPGRSSKRPWIST